MRNLEAGRSLTPVARERARYAAQIGRKPTTVTVRRRTGDGVSAPKALAEVASFTGRIDAQRPHLLRQGAVTDNDGWELVPIGHTLLALLDNDHPDGVSGSAVDVAQDDEILAGGQAYIVTAIVRGRAKCDIALISKS
jgi:hypothetical protein